MTTDEHLDKLAAALGWTVDVLRAYLAGLIESDPRLYAFAQRLGNVEYQLGIPSPGERRLLGRCPLCGSDRAPGDDERRTDDDDPAA
jgi:hypothetical protein